MKNKIFLLAFLFCACSSSTSIVSSWKNPDVQMGDVDFSKIIVAVLGNSEANRRIAEDRVAGLNDKLFPSYQVLTNEATATDKDKTGDILKSEGFDGIIVMKLLDKEKSQNYVPGTYTGGYWNMHPYYWGGFGYGGYYDPGYYTEDTNYVIETSLYDLKDNSLVWSSISNTVNPSSVEKTVEHIAVQSYKQMKEDGLIPAE
ncbi:hypothetical protein [Echinicola sp. 20G]|uniref:hypothetical protein n=1 Tax=Echinicola sp. 20G TaxID=2781961 RepID=UPI00190FF280|nr:hypothetical protein [Echinicola sp. 20G]